MAGGEAAAAEAAARAVAVTTEAAVAVPAASVAERARASQAVVQAVVVQMVAVVVEGATPMEGGLRETGMEELLARAAQGLEEAEPPVKAPAVLVVLVVAPAREATVVVLAVAAMVGARAGAVTEAARMDTR